MKLESDLLRRQVAVDIVSLPVIAVALIAEDLCR